MSLRLPVWFQSLRRGIRVNLKTRGQYLFCLWFQNFWRSVWSFKWWISSINAENIFSPCQFGFRKKRSTVQAILDLVSAILDAFHNKQYDPVLLLDLSEAFDCVDHGILLLLKLKYYNFDTTSVNLISSYLERRHQVVRVHSAGRHRVFGLQRGGL